MKSCTPNFLGCSQNIFFVISGLFNVMLLKMVSKEIHLARPPRFACVANLKCSFQYFRCRCNGTAINFINGLAKLIIVDFQQEPTIAIVSPAWHLNRFLYNLFIRDVAKMDVLEMKITMENGCFNGSCILNLVCGINNSKTRLAAIIPNCISLNLSAIVMDWITSL
jgi:hypothetical protein